MVKWVGTEYYISKEVGLNPFNSTPGCTTSKKITMGGKPVKRTGGHKWPGHNSQDKVIPINILLGENMVYCICTKNVWSIKKRNQNFLLRWILPIKDPGIL